MSERGSNIEPWQRAWKASSPAATRLSHVDGEAGRLASAWLLRGRSCPARDIRGGGAPPPPRPFTRLRGTLFARDLATRRDASTRRPATYFAPPPPSYTPPMDALRMAAPLLSLGRPEDPLDDALTAIAAFPTIVGAYARLRDGRPPVPVRADLFARRPLPPPAIRRRDPVPRARPRPRDLPQHRLRPRPQRLDLRRPRHRLDPLRCHLRDRRRCRRVERSAPRRRPRPRSRHGLRNRRPPPAPRPISAPASTAASASSVSATASTASATRAPTSSPAPPSASTRPRPPASHPRLYDLARAVEAVALRLLRERKPDRRLDTNVEFYTALLLHGLALPPDLHPDLRRRPRRRLGRPLPGATPRRPPHPPPIPLHRPPRSAIRTRGRGSLVNCPRRRSTAARTPL